LDDDQKWRTALARLVGTVGGSRPLPLVRPGRNPEEIDRVMRHAGDDAYGVRLRAWIIVLWRVGLAVAGMLGVAPAAEAICMGSSAKASKSARLAPQARQARLRLQATWPWAAALAAAFAELEAIADPPA
jgi:hypothetical protein